MLERMLTPMVTVCALAALAVATPAGALIAAWRVGPPRRARWLGHPAWWLVGAAGPAVLLMWFVFNGMANWFGLDSFPGLLANVFVFAVAGGLCGAILRFFPRAGRRGGDEEDPRP